MKIETSGGEPNREQFGDLLCGSVCGSAEHAKTRLCELETRSTCNDSRCIQSLMERSETICVSTLLHDRKVSGQESEGPGHVGIDHTDMADTNVVPEITGNGTGGSNIAASISGSADKHSGRQSQLMLVAWKVSGIGSLQEDFRKTLQPFPYSHGDPGHNLLIKVPGPSGLAGVVKGKSMHSGICCRCSTFFSRIATKRLGVFNFELLSISHISVSPRDRRPQDGSTPHNHAANARGIQQESTKAQILRYMGC